MDLDLGRSLVMVGRGVHGFVRHGDGFIHVNRIARSGIIRGSTKMYATVGRTMSRSKKQEGVKQEQDDPKDQRAVTGRRRVSAQRVSVVHLENLPT